MIRSAIIFFIVVNVLFSQGCGHIFFPKHVLMDDEGRYSQLEDLLEPEYKNDPKLPTKKLYYLCKAYGEQKKYKELFTCLDRLQKNIDSGDTSITVDTVSSTAFQMRAEAYLELGQYKKAVNFSEKAFQIASEKKLMDSHKVRALGVQVVALAVDGEKKKAKEMAETLENFRCGFVGGAVCNTEKRSNLVKAFMAVSNYEKALQYSDIRGLEKTLFEISRVIVLNPTPILMNITLPNSFLKSKCLYEVGRTEEAKKGYDALLAIAQIQDMGEIYWNILFDRGRMALEERKADEAINFFKKSIEVIEQQRSTINIEANKIGFAGDKQKVYQALIKTLFRENRHVEAFEYAERAKARALVDMLASKKHFGAGKMSEQKPLNTLLDNLEEAELSSLVQDDQMSPQKHAATRGITVQIKKKISQSDPELASLVTVEPSKAAEIQQLLPPDETLVEYFGKGDQLFAFVVSPHGVTGVNLDGKNLNQDIQRFRKNIMLTPEEIRGIMIKTTISDKPDITLESNRFKVIGGSLYERLFQPLEGKIFTKNVTIVPHGTLHYLPFNALNSAGEYLINRYNIRVLPSASVMKFLKELRKGHAGNILAFGNPDLGDPAYDLPWAQRETVAITEGQPKSKLLMRKNATETAVKSFGEQFRYIHFATHGTFDAEKPLSSGLLLASDGKNDGKLTVGELYDLHLPADLVTLSACETALGKVANGDDVVGFTRGLLYAGANSIVSSLWKVDDKATSILMQQFYQSLRETNKRSALRAAQLKVKDSYNAHPYFWAAFQIIGSIQ